MTGHSDPVTAEVVALIARIVARYTREYELAAERHGLTAVQIKTLRALDEPAPMRQIAQRLGSEPSNVTGIIDRLEARGLVRREAHPADRRVKIVVATAEGRAIAEELGRSLRFAAEPLAALDDEQRHTLRDLLRLMIGTEG
jgi:DNA-binding MarR family transcriptional regulator